MGQCWRRITEWIRRQRTAEPPRPRGSEQERGASLVDLLMATAVAATGFAGVFMTATAVEKLRRSDEEQMIAFHACRAQMEHLRDLPINQLAAENGRAFDVDRDGDGHSELVAPDGRSAGSVTVQVENAGANDTLYRVTVTVRWRGINGTRTLALPSLIGNRRGA